MVLELKHRVSKSASNEFWRLAMRSFPKLFEAKKNAGNHIKVPQFPSIRNLLYRDNLPDIKLEMAYESKETGDILILKDLDKTPVNRFPPSKFDMLYETVKVKVSNDSVLYSTIRQSTRLDF